MEVTSVPIRQELRVHLPTEEGHSEHLLRRTQNKPLVHQQGPTDATFTARNKEGPCLRGNTALCPARRR